MLCNQLRELGLFLAIRVLIMNPFKIGIGWLSIILGLLSLSMQLYLLPVIQDLEYLATGQALTYTIDYVHVPCHGIAMLLSIIMIIIGVILVKKSNIAKSS